MKSSEKKIIFENVIARVGFNEKALQEYARAISGLRGYQSFMEVNPPMPNTPTVPTNGAPTTEDVYQPMVNTTQV